MSTQAIQNAAISQMSVSRASTNEQAKEQNNLPSDSALVGVQYVKGALATTPEQLTDAELNALSHALTQLTAVFSIQQAFSANVTAFEQLEKALEALEELLEKVDIAKEKTQEGMRTIMISEGLSAAFGGMITAKAVHSAARQFQNTKVMNDAEQSLRARGGDSVSDVRVFNTDPDASDLKTSMIIETEVGLKPKLAKPDVLRMDVPQKDADKGKALSKQTKEGESPEAGREPVNPGEEGGTGRDPALPPPSDSELIERRDIAGAKAALSGQMFSVEMHAARLIQQFASSFKNLGETQQSLTQMQLSADQSVYSNESEYWSTLMGIFQRLSQEYQTTFQSDHGTLQQDVSQATMMAQYVYRS